MDTQELQPFSQTTLSEQDSSDRVTCTAHSLINLVTLAGGKVTDNEITYLKNKIVEEGKPLDSTFKETFIKTHGFFAENLYMFFQTEILFPQTVDAVANGLVSNLQRGPILLSIASELSQRDRRVVTEKDFGDKEADSHAVVAVIKGRAVFLIDPYKPYSPERFDINEEKQRLELVAWFTSSRARRTLIDSQKTVDSQSILNESISMLSNPKTAQKYIAETLSYTGPLLVHNS